MGGLVLFFFLFRALNNAVNNRVHKEGFPENGQQDEYDQDEEGDQPEPFYKTAQQTGEPESHHQAAEKQEKESEEGGNDDPGEVAGGPGEEADALQPVDLHP